MENLLLTQFDLHHRLYNNVLEDFSDEETNRRLHNNTGINHVKYLAGHLLNSQWSLAVVLGLKVDVKWNDLFAVMGMSEAYDNFEYPDIEEIKLEWNNLYALLREAIGKLSDEELKARPASPFDQVANSVGELCAFINHHTAYHLGQIGILRKGFGKAAMRYD